MDGIEGREGVIVLAATNRPDMIDTALLRPGRLDLIVELRNPNEEERRAIFDVHLRDRPIAPEVTANELARLTEGRSGADIEAICRRAALLALRDWISPKLNIGRVQITEATDDNTSEVAQTSADVAVPLVQDGPEIPDTANVDADATSSIASMPPVPSGKFVIRPEHFARAINEQSERYTVQDEADAKRAREERGRQRLIEMAADQTPGQRPPLRGFRLWLARLFGLV